MNNYLCTTTESTESPFTIDKKKKKTKAKSYLHAKQSLSEILTGSARTCLCAIDTFTNKCKQRFIIRNW